MLYCFLGELYASFVSSAQTTKARNSFLEAVVAQFVPVGAGSAGLCA